MLMFGKYCRILTASLSLLTALSLMTGPASASNFNFKPDQPENEILLDVQSGPDLNVGILPEFVQNELGQTDTRNSVVKPQLGSLDQGVVNYPELNSILFYRSQISLIRDFERGFFDRQTDTPTPAITEVPVISQRPAPPERTPRVTSQSPQNQTVSRRQTNLAPPTRPSPRELKLAGISYNGPEKWTVWLNGQRITPDNIPDEIFDINVKENYIEVVWHDKQTHKVFPVRLRPNQRFNLDARLFLPG